MTKQELYQSLQAVGIKLPDYRRVTAKELAAQYAIHLGEVPDGVPDDEERKGQQDGAAESAGNGDYSPEDNGGTQDVQQDDNAREGGEETQKNDDAKQQGQPPALWFNTAGWCEELQDSYFMGHYQCRSWEEYNALKKYAAKGGE